MLDVQIPQVMREFITRGVWTIQEWEPDQGLELRDAAQAGQGGSGCSERDTQKRRGQAGMGPYGLQVDGPSSDLLLAFREEIAHHEPDG
jgi:hypothetical protein